MADTNGKESTAMEDKPGGDTHVADSKTDNKEQTESKVQDKTMETESSEGIITVDKEVVSEDKKTEANTTEAKKETTDKDETTNKEETTEAKKNKTDKVETTEAKKETTEAKKETTEAKKETTEVKEETKEVKEETKEAKEETKEAKEEITTEDTNQAESKSEESKMETDSADVTKDTTEDTEMETESAEEKKQENTTNGVTVKSEENEMDKLTDLDKKIIRQIEYYFGDINLGRDVFLKSQIKEDDGWVSMETMLNFNRLKQLSEDTVVITSALKKSTSGLMEVSEDNTKIRRSPFKALPDNNSNEFKEQMRLRCIYAKSFPKDATLDDIQEFLDTFGEVEHTQLRRQDGKFKGSIFAMFKLPESAKKFLEAEEIKYKDTALEKREYRDEYFKRKCEEKKQTRESAHKEKEETKERQEEDRKEKLLKQITKGTILVLKGIPKDTNMIKLKEKFNEFSPVSWVDVDTENEEAKIRFSDAGAATTAWEKAQAAGVDGKVEVNSAEVTGRVLEGDEELSHWQDIFDSQKSRRNNRGGRGRGHHGGRGRHNNFGKRKHDNRDGNRPAKHFKAD